MSAKNLQKTDYFSLSNHSGVQLLVFLSILILSSIAFYILIIPYVEAMFTTYLAGKIYNANGETVQYLFEKSARTKMTDYYFAWAVDIYLGTPHETRFWFNPILSLTIPSLMFGFLIAFGVSAVISNNIGLIRQKIERELASMLDEITLNKYGIHSEEYRKEIIDNLLKADLRDLHDFEKEWGLNIEDVKTLHKGVKWSTSGFFYRIRKINDGIRVYLRFYITVKYLNAILGLVYIGAAVLIIIIGLRGLKFIPHTEPSLVFFALGLEFCMLILYATTLIYSREEETLTMHKNENSNYNNEFSNMKEVESLLKMFVKNDDNGKK